jgi:acyl carrier protein
MTDALVIVVDTLRALAREHVIPANLLEARLEAGTALRELGIDSIGMLHVLAELENRAGILLDERALAGCATIGDLASVIAAL